MIVEIKKEQERHDYGLFSSFFMEADDEPQYNPNTKVIDMKSSNRRMDFSSGTDDMYGDDSTTAAPEPAPEPAPTMEEPGDEMPPADDGGGEDFSSGSDDLGDTGGGGDAAPADDSGGGEDAGGSAEPEEGDDFSSGSDDLGDSGDDSSSGGDDGGSSGGGGSDGKTLDLDNGRKVLLYKEFVSLYTSIEGFITRLDSATRSSYSANAVFKRCTKDFRKLREMIYDYLILKFPASSYFQSLYFYQEAISSCQLILNTLEKLAKFRAGIK